MLSVAHIRFRKKTRTKCLRRAKRAGRSGVKKCLKWGKKKYKVRTQAEKKYRAAKRRKKRPTGKQLFKMRHEAHEAHEARLDRIAASNARALARTPRPKFYEGQTRLYADEFQTFKNGKWMGYGPDGEYVYNHGEY